jgi:hypothetical protein
MDLDTVTQFIKEVGFPIAVTAFVLWRFDKRLGELITEIRAFHVQMGSVLSNTAALAKHIVDQADRVVREVKELVR